MRYGIYLITICAVATFIISGHYGLNAYFKARQLKAQEENLTVRTRLMKRQVAELEQKMRVLKRVKHFVHSAKDLRLTPEHWSSYDVQIHDAIAYRELAQIVEQCIHNKDIYFWPTSLHVTVDPKQNASDEVSEDFEPVPVIADSQQGQSSDVALSLQGTFWVRH